MEHIYLCPGELWFGKGATRLRTILGSCIAVTLWHAQLRVGGMCHYMLPTRRIAGPAGLDGRYADEALESLVATAHSFGANAPEFEVKLFGGARMFSSSATPPLRGDSSQISDLNIIAGRRLLSHHGFVLKAHHLGGDAHREVVLDLSNGDTWLKHPPPRSLA